MIDLIAEAAKLIVRLTHPSEQEIIERQKKLLEEFNEKMKAELGEGWSLSNVVERGKSTETKETPSSKISKAFKLLKEARDEAGCPVVRDTIDELLLTMEERLAKRISSTTGSKLLNEIIKVLEEEGVEDWDSLSPEEKSQILSKIKRRI